MDSEDLADSYDSNAGAAHMPTREEGLEAVAGLAVKIGEDMIQLLREMYELYVDVGLTIPQPLRGKVERAIRSDKT